MCDKEAKQKWLLVPINQATERVVTDMAKPQSRLLRMPRKHRNMNVNNLDELLKCPRKKRLKDTHNFVFVGDFDNC
jgi:hypothetical protein